MTFPRIVCVASPSGTSRAAVENSPHLEAFRARGVEVLILTDPVDENWIERDCAPGAAWVVGHLATN